MSRTNRLFLVTGASGFVGRALVDRLVGDGATVHGVSRVGAGDRRAAWSQVDLVDRQSVRDLIETTRPDVVFNLAGRVTGERALDQVRPTLSANLLATANLLEAVAEVGCERFVQIGSLEEPEGVEEPPNSPYAAAKAASTAYALMFERLFSVPATVARLFMVYGPGPGPATRLIPRVITSVLTGAELKLTSGERPIDWIYLADVVEGLVRIAGPNALRGKVVDLGSGLLVPAKEVVEKLFALLEVKVPPPFGTLPDRPFERVRAADIAQTEAMLGWRPETDLDTGLAATVDWHRRGLAGSI